MVFRLRGVPFFDKSLVICRLLTRSTALLSGLVDLVYIVPSCSCVIGSALKVVCLLILL